MARNQRILEADEDESDEDSDSDSDEEDEVERALDESQMDTDEISDPANGSPRKRKISKNEDDADWGLDIDEGLTKQLLSFDIYLKGNVSKATSFFKSAGGQTHRFRMFPYVEKKRRVDEYGETIDVGMWLRKGKVLENEADDEATREARRNQAEGETEVKFLGGTNDHLTDEPNARPLVNPLRSSLLQRLRYSLLVDFSLLIWKVLTMVVR
jgi:cleavage and polyadenylation specificity factor subunit 2